jgi:hypothetical protein
VANGRGGNNEHNKIQSALALETVGFERFRKSNSLIASDVQKELVRRYSKMKLDN